MSVDLPIYHGSEFANSLANRFRQLYQTPGSYSLMAFTCTASPPRHTTGTKPKTHICKRQYETRASLEIPILNLDPEMLDLIVVSWVFMERRRRQKAKKVKRVDCGRGVKADTEVESSVEGFNIQDDLKKFGARVESDYDESTIARAF